jgi:rhamnosyltransferase
LVVGRFVPENNYEIILREFMKSETKKDLILITNYQENKFSKDLENKLNFSSDSRIKFIGTVYDAELLKKIRENAFAYIHGHSVGGTNPSLLEALASTKLNILYDVCFNRECGGHAALYFNKEADSLKYVIKLAESLDEEDIKRYEEYAKKEVQERYSWNFICSEYETLFLKEE